MCLLHITEAGLFSNLVLVTACFRSHMFPVWLWVHPDTNEFKALRLPSSFQRGFQTHEPWTMDGSSSERLVTHTVTVLPIRVFPAFPPAVQRVGPTAPK